jgi:hypothetical protein
MAADSTRPGARSEKRAKKISGEYAHLVLKSSESLDSFFLVGSKKGRLGEESDCIDSEGHYRQRHERDGRRLHLTVLDAFQRRLVTVPSVNGCSILR